MNKKSVEINIKVIIILIIALIVLVVSIFFFSSAAREIASNLMNKIKNAFGLLNATM